MDLLQWIACIVALVGSYLVSAERRTHRLLGFALFLVSNVLWIWWGTQSSAWALVTMQSAFCLTSALGVVRNRADAQRSR